MQGRNRIVINRAWGVLAINASPCRRMEAHYWSGQLEHRTIEME
jgi:hypothetical protein